MGWFKKKKRNPCKVVVHFDDLAGDKFRAGHKFEREIVIPDGYTFKHGFA